MLVQEGVGQNPGARGVWIRRRYAVVGDSIVPIPRDPLREYDPFQPGAEWDGHSSRWRDDLPAEPDELLCLTVKLANTNTSDPRSVEAFTTTFGPLGCGLDGVTWDWDAYVEDLADFARAAQAFQDDVRLYARWEQTDEDSVAHEWSERIKGPLALAYRVPYPAHLSDRKVVKQLLDTYGLVAQVVVIEDGTVVLKPDKSLAIVPRQRFRSTWAFPNLLVAAYVDLFDRVQSGLGPRECANPTCRRIFLPIREDRRYCRVSCSTAVRQRERRAAERQRLQAGERESSTAPEAVGEENRSDAAGDQVS